MIVVLDDPDRRRKGLAEAIDAVTALLPADLSIAQPRREKVIVLLDPHERRADRKALRVMIAAPQDDLIEADPRGGVKRSVVSDDGLPVPATSSCSVMLGLATAEPLAGRVGPHPIRRISDHGVEGRKCRQRLQAVA
jgi:hypothetical protein